jgi:hypothetical protein
LVGAYRVYRKHGVQNVHFVQYCQPADQREQQEHMLPSATNPLTATTDPLTAFTNQLTAFTNQLTASTNPLTASTSQLFISHNGNYPLHRAFVVTTNSS